MQLYSIADPQIPGFQGSLQPPDDKGMEIWEICLFS